MTEQVPEQPAQNQPQGQPLDWSSTLDSVVVHASGAVCRRRAHGILPAGAEDAGPLRLRLTGLPRVLDGQSLRAGILGAAHGWRVSEVRPAVAARLRGPGELPELRRRREQLADREASLRGLQGVLERRIAQTAALRAVEPAKNPEDPHRRTPADAFLALADFVDQRLTALHARAEELREQLELVAHEVSLLDDQLERASDAEPATPLETSAVAVVTLTREPAHEAARELTLELEYLVPGALWVPAYRLTHRRGDGGGTLVLRAEVAQRTGEDWTDVRLGFSTADLHRSSELPRLRSIRIGRSQPAPPPSGWREPPAGLGELFTGYDRAEPPADRRVLPALGGRPLPPPVAVAYGTAQPPAAPTPSRPAARAMRAKLAMAEPQAFGGAAGPAGPLGAAPGAPAPAADMAPAPPAPPAGPATELLDYAALTLAGPTEPPDRRGRLHPETAALAGPEHAARRRAESLADALPLPAHAVRPRYSAGSFDHRYDAPARTDLPSDGGWHTVTICEIPVSLRTEYVCVPSVDPAVFATLLLANDSGQALLAGPLEVTVDGDFLLGTALPTLAPGATRRVGLGVAESVRATRRTEVQESTAGLRGGITVVEQRVHVGLANRLGHAVTVEVRERIPVPGDKDIRIEDRPGSPGWTAPAEASEAYPAGTRLWRVELPAGGRAQLEGGYEIRIPAGKALTGGNRRN
ncbi:hypothetical protein P3T37_003507 [Kitasatospora sp. MAA4]|uniref:DUF4139 domain-containing protein n=1 Tax=Kitasatospora sp. MAA4 TaxID=3035093 RepID=UPI002476262D|nr:DUF4139 domain-containing protein [Kitasatospora sp. MAA4]MDH6134105.1 hypothetical protein [Kitasatospora sp. MAA4]